MRPLKLKMRAFGAYINPVELDFEDNLRGTKLFLINGETGAGKTTILDAMCFALYGTASGEDRKGNMMRSKGITDKINTEVELTFELGEKKYIVYRALTVKLEKGEKKFVQNAKLICSGEILDNKKTTVDSRIKELLGFNVEQFRQVVLLPQGEFRTFLFSKADERQKVLNAIFNAELYKRVETALKIKSDAAQIEFEELNCDKKSLETQLQGSKIDETALEELRTKVAVAQEKTIALQKIFDKAQSELTNGEKLSSDFEELERRKKSLETAEKNLADAEKIYSDTKIEFDLQESKQSERDKLKSDLDKLAEIKKALDELEAKQKSLDDAEKKLQAAIEEVKKFEEQAEQYAELLSKRKQRRDELTGAEKNLADAENVLNKVREREELLQKITRLEANLKRAQQEISLVEKNYNAAQIELERLQKLQRDGSAALLAKNLKDGEPCPVCGSRVHEYIDFSEKIIPSDKEIKEAQAISDNFKKDLDSKRISAAQIQSAIDTKREELEKYSDVPDKEGAQKKYKNAQEDANELEDVNKRIKRGEKCITDNEKSLKKARDIQIAASNEREKIFGAVQILQAQIDEKYLANLQKLNADIAKTEKTLRELEMAWKNSDKKFRVAEKQKSSCEGIFSAAQRAKTELSDKLKDKTPPELDKLKKNAQESQRDYFEAVKAETSLKNLFENLEKLSAQILELDKKISVAEKNLRVWKKLSEVASGNIPGRKISFVRYYLRAMFEEVLTEANYRLEKMSDRRYWFKQKDKGKVENSTAGLNLEIFDEYTGEARPVETLSGGESFLASLSLALGLAAVVRNNAGGIKLDTIFIDEGFGSLDSEKLNFAISTINELSGGRLVGIISHVEELKNQIPVRLEVYKSETGSKAEFKSGLS